jgi:hypothetical protein
MKKLIMDDLCFVGKIITNVITDGFIDEKSMFNKKYYSLYSVGISIDKYDITPIKKSYVIPSMVFLILPT